MAPQGVKRKLTAILSADVRGYTRVMGEDEVATVRTLGAYRELMVSLIQQHRGRVVDIARTSTFTDKGKPVKVQHVSEELAVRYVLNDPGVAAASLAESSLERDKAAGEKGIAALRRLGLPE